MTNQERLGNHKEDNREREEQRVETGRVFDGSGWEKEKAVAEALYVPGEDCVVGSF